MMTAGIVAITAAAASADTRIMPARQALVGTSIVVWGNTTLANGTAYTLDCGNGTSTVSTVSDRSYIQRSCTYGSANSFTATLTVGAESASTTIAVVDGATAPVVTVRDTKINMAIEDGLRFLYQSQLNRATAFDTNMTTWVSNTTSSSSNSFVALAILSFENHGHPFNGTDIYAPVVQRGLNYLFDKLAQQNMSSDCGTAADPCINVPAPTNIGLVAQPDGTNGYATPIYAAAIAAAVNASGATTVGAGIGSNNANFVAGRTYAEILQRIVNADAWGQSSTGLGTGGWYYGLRAGSSSDGSTTGWQMLGLFDSQAAGAILPAFVKTRFNALIPNQLNTNGTWDYQVNGNPASAGDMTKVGVSLQGLAFVGVTAPDARITAAENYITRNWTTQVDSPEYNCGNGTPSANNKGCGYSMFNIFKGLKAHGVAALPGILRPAGGSTGMDGTAADDWYADYVDTLLADQKNANNAAGGQWDASGAPFLAFSGYSGNTPTGSTALAELILSPVAFVLPDPIRFSTVGLSELIDTNLVGTEHTVTAFSQSSTGDPVPGATIKFVVSGQNVGATGTCSPAGCITPANGKVSFTYHDTNGLGNDTIQAFIGTLGSNIVNKHWVAAAALKCDANNDRVVSPADLKIILAANGQAAAGPNDPRDGNGDGSINVADYRYCYLRLTAQQP